MWKAARKSPFKIKAILKLTLSTKALSGNSQDANKSRHDKGSPKKKKANTLFKGSLSKKQLKCRIRGHKKLVKRKRKPFRIKDILKPTLSAKALSGKKKKIPRETSYC